MFQTTIDSSQTYSMENLVTLTKAQITKLKKKKKKQHYMNRTNYELDGKAPQDPKFLASKYVFQDPEFCFYRFGWLSTLKIIHGDKYRATIASLNSNLQVWGRQNRVTILKIVPQFARQLPMHILDQKSCHNAENRVTMMN
jgi:hypothetical protein